ncbi:CYTH domain, partial [Trinorchestia longiramus]
RAKTYLQAEGSGVKGGLQSIRTLLAASIGVRGEVMKTRHLFMVGQTRVHVDRVQGLGDFMELEVVLREDQTAADGQVIAGDLMKRLGVQEADLLSGAYMDMIES